MLHGHVGVCGGPEEVASLMILGENVMLFTRTTSGYWILVGTQY